MINSLFSSERQVIFEGKYILVHHGYSVVLEPQYPVVNICKQSGKYEYRQNIMLYVNLQNRVCGKKCKSRIVFLTHLSLASLLWDIGKQNSPTSDAAECGVPSGAILFAWRNFLKK